MFCFGWPQAYSVSTTDLQSVVSLSHNPGRTLLAVLTSHTISIWSCVQGAGIQIGVYRHANQHVLSYGQNNYVVWKQDSTKLAIVTDKNHIFFLTLAIRPPPPIYIPAGDRRRESSHNAALMKIAHFKLVKILRFADSILCCVPLLHNFLVSSADQCLRVVEWDGKVGDRIRWPHSSITNASHDQSVVHMSHCPHLQLISLVTQNGSAFIAPTHSLKNTIAAHIISLQHPASLIAFNHLRRQLAVGLNTGQVHIYSISISSSEIVLSLSFTLSSTPLDYTPADTGPVSALEFSPDSSCIAVGWEYRGMAIWSSSGCRCMCTLPQITSTDATLRSTGSFSADQSAALPIKEEPFRNGVSVLSWNDGFTLWGCSRISTNDSSICDYCPLIGFSFMKPCIVSNPSSSERSSLYLLGDHHFLVFKPHVDLDSASKWERLCIPPSYSLGNGPLKCIAVSPLSRQLAVSGKHGLLLLDIASMKWQMFGDPKEEESVSVCAISWCSEDIVCVADQNCRLLFFNNNSLSFNSLLYSESLSHEPDAVDIEREYLLTHMVNGLVLLYKVLYDKESLRLVLLHSLLRDTVPPLQVRLGFNRALSVTSNQPCQKESEIESFSDDENVFVLFLELTGSLIRMGFVSKQPVVVATKVDQFWEFNIPDYNNTTALFVSGEYGFEMFLPLPSSDTKPVTSSDTKPVTSSDTKPVSSCITNEGRTLYHTEAVFDFQEDVLPIGIDTTHGVVVGVSKGVHIRRSYRLQARLQPYVHSLLKYLVAEAYECSEFFQFVLELLLHTVMDDDQTSICNSRSSMMTTAAHSITPSSASTTVSRLNSMASPPRHSCTLLASHGRMHIVSQMNLVFQPKKKIDRLPLVVNFLRNFPQYVDIVVNCARKTDSCRWNRLFGCAGKAAALFERTVSEKKFRTASCYLTIIQVQDGPAKARGMALSLLDEAFHADQVSICHDILRFFMNVRIQSEQEESQQLLSVLQKRITDWSKAEEMSILQTSFLKYMNELKDSIQNQHIDDGKE